jgi:hypothetical protein
MEEPIEKEPILPKSPKKCACIYQNIQRKHTVEGSNKTKDIIKIIFKYFKIVR